MSRTIRISDELYVYIQEDAIPLEDTPDSVLLKWAEQLDKIRKDSNSDLENQERGTGSIRVRRPPAELVQAAPMGVQRKLPIRAIYRVSVSGREVGINLYDHLFSKLRGAVKPGDIREIVRQSVIEISGSKIFTRYANLNRNQNYYFGFNPRTMDDQSDCSYTILLCGETNLIHVFAIPYDEFVTFASSGVEVGKSKQYQSHIYPDQGYILSVTGNPSVKIDMKNYLIFEGDFDENMASPIISLFDGS